MCCDSFVHGIGRKRGIPYIEKYVKNFQENFRLCIHISLYIYICIHKTEVLQENKHSSQD